MLLPALGLMLPAFAALALAMDRHHEALTGRPLPAARRRGLRLLAFALLATAFGAACRQPAPAQAVVDLVVAASVAALAVAAGLTWGPRRGR